MVHLSLDKVATNVVVMWSTVSGQCDSVVQYSSDVTQLDQSASGSVTQLTQTQVNQSLTHPYLHKVVLQVKQQR